MTRTGLLIGVAIAAISFGAQTKPDFSGRWTTDPDPAAAADPAGRGAGQRAGGRGPAADAGSGWGATITVTQDAQKLVIEVPFFGRSDMQPPLRFTFALDGSESRNQVMMGRGVQVQTSRTSWDGETLVIKTSHAFTDPVTGKPATAEVTQILSLAAPSLVVDTTRAGVMGGPAVTTKTTYRKVG